MTAELTINNVLFERNDQPLFQPISAVVQAGELLQIQGANGSGKSTLLRMIAGFMEPHAGKIHWQKKSIFTQLNEYQSNVSYIGHQNGIKPLLTVSENLRLQCAFLGCKVTNEKIASVIEAIHLRKLTHTLANQLSAGQLRRLSLAHLLLNPALLWILDEPITALDTEGQDFFIELLKQHLKKNGMAIIATHNDLSLTSQIQVCQSLLH